MQLYLADLGRNNHLIARCALNDLKRRLANLQREPSVSVTERQRDLYRHNIVFFLLSAACSCISKTIVAG